MPNIEKGQHIKLNVTLKARHRVLCGLGWDPAEEPGLIGKVKALAGKEAHHDLDLACYTFSKDQAFLEVVCADESHYANKSETIYHSGDNAEGHGDGDDEEISAELKNLPPEVEHIVFAAIIRTNHNFADIASPEMRLADGYTNYNFLALPLSHSEGRDKNVFVFAHLYRSMESDTGWMLHNISDYMNYTGDRDFPERIKRFLTPQAES